MPLTSSDPAPAWRPTTRTSILAIGIVVIVALLFIGRALTGGTRNFVTDPSFQGSQLGWMGWNGRVSRAAPGRIDGSALLVVSSGLLPKVEGFGTYTFPRPIIDVRRGETYRASAWVRTNRASAICLVLREWSRAARAVGTMRKCVLGSAAWRAFPAVSYTTRSRGGELEIVVLKVPRQPHDSFAVDDVTLVGESR